MKIYYISLNMYTFSYKFDYYYSIMPVELIAPAGSDGALDAAVAEGADAVCLGLKIFDTKAQSAYFTYSRFELALRALRRMGKKTYVPVDTVFEQREADRIYQLLKYLSAVGPDAVIVRDFGVIAMLRSEFPALKIHASAAMNIASGSGANALSKHGVSRVALAKELGPEELRSLRGGTNMELEVLVHGALCVSASGLCLFSSYLGGKSANRGMCTQACRRRYFGETESEQESGYYFSPADLQLLEQLPELAAAGINAIAIEGHMKSADYIGTVVSAYRLVLDAIAEGNEDTIRRSIEEGQVILRGDFARSKTRNYFYRAEKRPDWLDPDQDGTTGISLGPVLQVQDSGDTRLALVSPGGAQKIRAGDSIRLYREGDSARVVHKLRFVREAQNGGYWISIPGGFGANDRVYLIQTKAMSKRYKPVIADNAKTGARSPGFEKAPLPEPRLRAHRAAKPGQQEPFPEGLYVAVSRVEDLYAVQSIRPEMVLLALTRKTARRLLSEDKPPLPFSPPDIMLTLDPFFPQADADFLADIIPQLADLGYRRFAANNPGHFSLLRKGTAGSGLLIVAGPWLYMFNTWSLSFLASLGADGFVSPLENNRQNAERTLAGNSLRSRVFIPVFAWPSLFRIRADLGHVYDFKALRDSRDEYFSLLCGPEGSTVIPQQPFSITDKIPFLKEAGFRRFIVDLSGPPLKKNDYKDLMRAIENGVPLPGVTRFNWKDGFYNK